MITEGGVTDTGRGVGGDVAVANVNSGSPIIWVRSIYTYIYT